MCAIFFLKSGQKMVYAKEDHFLEIIQENKLKDSSNDLR